MDAFQRKNKQAKTAISGGIEIEFVKTSTSIDRLIASVNSLYTIMLLFSCCCSSKNRTVSFIHMLPLLLLYLAKQTQGQSNHRVVMFPNADDQVLERGATLELTCATVYQTFWYGPYDQLKFTWTLPDIVKYDNRIESGPKRLSYSYDSNQTNIWTTLTLTNTKPEDTGYYACLGEEPSTYRSPPDVILKRKYVYVYDANHKFVHAPDDHFFLQQGEAGIFPCIATHPNVTMSLFRINRYNINGVVEINTEEKDQDLLSRNNSNWELLGRNSKITKGFILKNSTINDSGEYICSGKMNNKTINVTTIIYVKGLELLKLDGLDDVLEGTNVTLLCRTSNKVREDPSPLLWYQINSAEFGKRNQLNTSNLPEGMDITTRSHIKAILIGKGRNLFTESILKLHEVPLNASTKFQCTGNDGADSKEISFRVKEMNNETVIVHLEKGRPKNLTCIRPSEKYKIRWFKNENTYLGSVYWNANASSLQLLGLADEIGNYTCHWNNSLGEARFKTFSITYEDKDILNEPPEKQSFETVAIAVSIALAILLLVSVIIGVRFYLFKKQQVLSAAEKCLKGNLNSLNRDLPVEEQTEQLPYDKRWEFPRHRLKLGTQLGVGCFGVVIKAEAVGIKGLDGKSKTVAVKMPRSQTNNLAALEDLISELKVMIYIGSHLNVLNLLGACTKSIHKGELLIIVEYCQFGNLQNYILKNRNSFINQVDELGNIKIEIAKQEKTESHSKSPIPQEVDATFSCAHQESSDGYLIPCNIEKLFECDSTPPTDTGESISTKDLVSWSYQIARGMDYLSGKKVLHGDLAARNVLLADNGVVKVSDFGMARKMYYESNYEKKGQALMPIKWMAPESLTDRILSTESDVWSYGILIWELFSLGKVPYPGIETQKLIKELENGYRMEKPVYAPNFIGDIMEDCWKKEPKDRPHFSQLEEIIGSNMESSLSSYYCVMNAPYEKFNYEKTVAPKTGRFGLAKLLNNSKPGIVRSLSQRDSSSVRYIQSPQSRPFSSR